MGKQYLDKVIDHILKKTDIDYDIKQITNWPFYRHGMGFNIFMESPHSVFGNLKRHFYFYCNRWYGLTKEESKYVWEGYINILGETIKLIGGNINESVDKQKQYLNRVLENLKGETVIDIRDGRPIVDQRMIYFKYPFQNEIKVRNINGILPPHISKVWGDNSPDVKYLYRDFLNHCMNIYGLTKEEFDNFIKPKYNNWLFNTMKELPMFEDGLPLYTHNINWSTLTIIE